MKGEILMDEKLEYADFKEKLTGEVEQFLPSGGKVRCETVQKMNFGRQDAIVLDSDEKSAVFAPNFYFSQLYDRYLSGESVEGIARSMIHRFLEVNLTDQGVKKERLYSFEQAKGHLFYRVVSAERNREILSDILHEDVLDLAVVFCMVVTENRKEIGMVNITKEQVERWGVPGETVKEAARENAEKLFPAEKMKIGKMIAMLLSDPEAKKEMTEEPELPDLECGGPLDEVYVLTNQKRTDGFAAVFYKDVLKEIAEEKGSDLFILPSSIHEGLVLPARRKASVKELRRMVDETNRECVQTEDRLSDHVYLYDRKRDMLCFA